MNTATTAAPQLPPGTVIDGTYTMGAVVRSRLGAVTYAATDMSGARVDVTIYAPECFVSPVALERSLRELRQLEKVHAPQVLRILDAGKLPRGGIYEVHEHTDARPLSELGAIPPAEVGRLIHEIVVALQAAQKVGVLHRNLGAEAILRGDRGIKVTGFAVGDPQGGVSFGALDCIAPEQVEGKNIDERTLVYNLAALTFRFLRGASLFTGGDNGTQLLQAAASLPAAESMPTPLFAALAKDPKARPNLLARFLGDLDAIIRDFPTTDADGHASSLRDPEPTPDGSKAGEQREVGATLATLMTDPDAPKLPSSDPQAGTAAAAGNTALTPDRSVTSPPRPAIITGPGMLGAPPTLGMKPVATPGASVPALGGLPNAPSLGSLGKTPPLPTLAAPPGVGRSLPTLGAPAKIAPPTFGAPLTPPGLTPPGLAPPGLTPPGLTPPGLTPPTFNAPAAAPSASASANPNNSSKPRTRGWTMFMEVTEEEAAGAAGGVPLPGGGPATAPTPVTGAPASPATATPASPATATPASPTTAIPASSAATTAAATGAATPAGSTPATAGAAPAGTPEEVKPSTRGWTMIMDEPTDAEPAALGLSTPAAAATPPPPSPTTRGWTMLEELNDSVPATTAAAATPAPAPETGAAPSSRGWTMFMEAELQGGGTKPEDADGEPAEPEFFDGPVQTDAGTVITFAPTAAEPNVARMRPEADLGGQEPMRSFGARLRGDGEEAAPRAPSLSPESAPSFSADIPSFAGNKLGSVSVAPVSVPLPKVKPQPEEPEQVEVTGGSNTMLIVVGLVVVIAIVVVIVMATR